MKSNGEACVLCLRCNKFGPAIWTDMVRECPIEHDTVLLCDEGHLYAESVNQGGIYLILWASIDEAEHIVLEQEPPEQPKRNHDIDGTAVKGKKIPDITLEHCQSSMALWEKLDRGIREQRKRAWDLMAHPELEDEDDNNIDELKTGTSQDGHMQLTRVGHQNKKRKTQ